jgi:Asp-tRNA(Asn)/Glu-tRNA(Gln) amidotransferase A subunit family amidase
MQAVLDAQPWILDPKVTPLPWRHEQYQQIQARPMTIGVLVDDGVVRVHPPIERALKDLVAKLEAAGHEIVSWDASGHKECIEIMVSRLGLSRHRVLRRLP